MKVSLSLLLFLLPLSMQTVQAGPVSGVQSTRPPMQPAQPAQPGKAIGQTGQLKSQPAITMLPLQVQAETSLELLDERMQQSKNAAAYVQARLNPLQRQQLVALQQLFPRALQDPSARQQLDQQWAGFVRSVKLSGSSLGVMELMEALKASAYDRPQAQLARATARLQETRTQQRHLANELQRAEAQRRQWSQPSVSRHAYRPANLPGIKASRQITTRPELEGYINELIDRRDSLADMSQMLQLQLQDAMNKQAQAMQMISNIMKSMHDTASAVIRNIK